MTSINKFMMMKLNFGLVSFLLMLFYRAAELIIYLTLGRTMLRAWHVTESFIQLELRKVFLVEVYTSLSSVMPCILCSVCAQLKIIRRSTARYSIVTRNIVTNSRRVVFSQFILSEEHLLQQQFLASSFHKGLSDENFYIVFCILCYHAVLRVHLFRINSNYNSIGKLSQLK